MFNVRFSRIYPDVSNNLNITEESIRIRYPVLYEMANMVRRYSVLIKKKSIEEIYNAITLHADPRVGLVMAAARTELGDQIFPDFNTVIDFMFNDNATGSDPNYQTKTVFIDGISRVSAALAASTLIGQLAQLPEQADHAKVLEKQALDDLDRIIKIPYLTQATKSTKELELDTISIYFEDKTFDLDDSVIQAKIYCSNGVSSNWIDVSEHTEIVNTSDIVIAIADECNKQTLLSNNSNILAAPILSSNKNGFHEIQFSSRLRKIEISTEVISIEIRLSLADGTEQQKVPFNWGNYIANLTDHSVNSVLLSVKEGRVSSNKPSIYTSSLNVLYIRKKINSIVPTTANLEFRVSPTMTESNTISIIRRTSSDPNTQLIYDQLRRSDLAINIVNYLFENKESIKLLAAIIKNDPVSLDTGETAIELIPWIITNKEIWMILDVLQIPDDLELALGTYISPVTAYSSNPRSVRVECTYDFSGMNNSDTKAVDSLSVPKVLTSKSSKLLEQVNYIRNNYEIINKSYDHTIFTHRP